MDAPPHAGPPSRILYFDLDGTLIHRGFGKPKLLLAAGGFERAVRAARFDHLVCVGNAMKIVRYFEEVGTPNDGHEMILRLCPGVFLDEAWFRSVTTWSADPSRRVRHIDTAADWWWVDDEAARYCGREGLAAFHARHCGTRIFEPDPGGDGGDVLEWLGRARD